MLKNAAKQAMSILFMGYHILNSLIAAVVALPLLVVGNQGAKAWAKFCVLHSPRIAACYKTAKHEPVFRRWGASKDWDEEAITDGHSLFMRIIYATMAQVKTIYLSQ